MNVNSSYRFVLFSQEFSSYMFYISSLQLLW